MSRSSRFLNALKQQAWSIACADVPWEDALCSRLREFFGDDTYLHVVRFTRTSPMALCALVWADAPERPDALPSQHNFAIDNIVAHPGIRAMIAEGTASPIRLSDLTDLPRFRDTELFQHLHRYPVGTRFACAAPLVRTSEELVLVGGHRVHRDFSDEAMDLLAALQFILAPALRLRDRLELLASTDAPAYRVVMGSPDGGLRLPAGPSGGDYWPSSREQQVLGLLTLGLTSRQIARRLDITERTVRKHLNSVYHKANLPGRAAAAAWWQRRAG